MARGETRILPAIAKCKGHQRRNASKPTLQGARIRNESALAAEQKHHEQWGNALDQLK